MKKRPTRLTALKIEELSLVDSPANKGSRVILAKREDGMFKPCENCKSMEKCSEMKKCAGDGMMKSDETTGLVTLLRRLAKRLGIDPNQPDDAGATEDDVSKKDYSKMSADELRAELAKRDDSPKGGDDSAERLQKMEQTLAATSERLEKAEKEAKESAEKVAKLAAERAERHVTSVAKGMVGNAVVELSEVTTILKQVDDEGSKALQSILKKFSGIVEEAELFEPVGKRGEPKNEGSAHETLHKRAVELSKSEGVSYSEAVVMAMEEDPDAYEASLAENVD